MKTPLAAVLLALTLALGATGAAAQPSNAEIWEKIGRTKIDGIRFLVGEKKFAEAREEIVDILRNGSFSAEIRAGAIMQRGHIGMRTSDYKAALKDYQIVQQMPGVSAELKKQAQTAAEFADSFVKLRQ